MRSEHEVNTAMEKYADTVRRLCMIHLKSYHDSEDIFQTVFLKYVLSTVKFESEEHEKAWFIRVTINACKDFFKDFFRSHIVPLENLHRTTAKCWMRFYLYRQNTGIPYISITTRDILPLKLLKFSRKIKTRYTRS